MVKKDPGTALSVSFNRTTSSLGGEEVISAGQLLKVKVVGFAGQASFAVM